MVVYEAYQNFSFITSATKFHTLVVNLLLLKSSMVYVYINRERERERERERKEGSTCLCRVL